MLSRIRLQSTAVYLFVFSINFETIKIFEIDFLITKVTFLYLFFTCLITELKLFNLKPTLNIFFPLIVYFILLTAIGYNNINVYSDNYFDLAFLLNLISFLLLVNIFKKDPLLADKSMIIYTYSTVFICLLALLDIGTTVSFERLTMFGMNSNYLGFSCAIGILVLVNKLNGLNFLVKAIYLFFIVCLFSTLILTASRTGLFFLIAGFGAFLFFSKLSLQNKIISRLLSIVFILPILLIAINDTLLYSRSLNTLNFADLSARDFIWLKTFEIISSSPIIGVGKTGYAANILEFFDLVLSTHNVFIEVLVYTGIVGFIFFMTFFFRISKIVFKKNISTNSIIFFIGLFVLMMSSQIFEPKLPWILFSYIVSDGILSNKKSYN
tara:strand:+ start:2502 stop:3644 length:1143 start_codon:yes stop_codon:yes gene_type:complete